MPFDSFMHSGFQLRIRNQLFRINFFYFSAQFPARSPVDMSHQSMATGFAGPAHPLLTGSAVGPNRFNAPGGVAVAMPVEAGTPPAAFRSPTATALLGATAAGSTFPACCYRSVPFAFTNPFGLPPPLPTPRMIRPLAG
jgi:hypothetical protein